MEALKPAGAERAGKTSGPQDKKNLDNCRSFSDSGCLFVLGGSGICKAMRERSSDWENMTWKADQCKSPALEILLRLPLLIE